MPAKRALIFANGDQQNKEAVQQILQPDDYLIAADGGLHYLHLLGLAPHLLIGDLNSVSMEEVDQVTRANGRVLRYPIHKDETDLELALLLAVQEGFQEILILGALGGRLDMTLANIFLLMLPELAACDIRLEDGIEEVFLVRPGVKGHKILGQPGDRVSLLPWGSAASGIRTVGLFYPLKGETLFPERTRGISNEMQGAEAEVFFESGLLICIHTRAASGADLPADSPGK